MNNGKLDNRLDLEQVEGWFYAADQALFRWFLECQDALGVTGDLVEVGTYFGKSAIVLGAYVRPGETLTVVDLFGTDAPDQANKEERDKSHARLTQGGFEANYLKFHDELPSVYAAPSSSVVDHVAPGTARFGHIDASHLYDHVVEDTRNFRSIVKSEGVVVYDDYLQPHLLGTVAAVWEAVLIDGFRPICATPGKLYGTWGDPQPYRTALGEHLSKSPELFHDVWNVAGHEVFRIVMRQPQRPVGPSPAELRAEIRRLRARLRRTRARLDQILTSRTYRVGRAVTAPVRALRRG